MDGFARNLAHLEQANFIHHTFIMEIDDSLYSRQRYMLGDHAMKALMHSHVILIHCGGVGIEIAKNLVLTGVQVRKSFCDNFF